MSCPICSHTMQNLGVPPQRVFWCAHCGTLKICTGAYEATEPPGMLRHVIQAANLDPGKRYVSQRSTVAAQFIVGQSDEDHPTVSMEIKKG